MNEYMKAEEQRLKNCPTEQHYTISYYSDAEKTEPCTNLSDIDTNEFVYYELVCDPGYYVKWINIDAEYMDSEKLRFGKHTPDAPEVNCVRVGDVNSDGVANLADVISLMKFMVVEHYDYSSEMTSADFNGDGKFDLADCTLFMKYLAKWDVDILGESLDAPKIYCSYDKGMADGTSHTDKWSMFYNANIIKSLKGLEEYIQENRGIYTEDNEYSAGMLKEIYNEDFFVDNELVLLDYSDHIADGKVYAETSGQRLKLFVNNMRSLNIPFNGKTVFHNHITVSKKSGIELDDSIEIYTRDYNNTGARYLLQKVDIKVAEEHHSVKYYE